MIDHQECLHALFEFHAAKNPDAIALTYAGEQMTYGELNRRANQLAHFLQKKGAAPDVLVGLCVDRSFEMLIGILGILKSGAAYVPLDPHYPKQRLATIIEDSQIPLLITQAAYRDELLQQDTCTVFSFEEDQVEWAQESDQNPVSGVRSDNLAYVIYTSGSTGKPKGVLIQHDSVTRLFGSTAHWYGFHEKDVWPLFHSFAFDVSVWEIWGAFLHGGRLVVVPQLITRDFEQFYNLVEDEKVTVLNQTPTAFKQFMLAEEVRGREGDLSLRYVIFAGEALHPQILRPWFERHGDEQPLLVNMYGITETTVHATYRLITWNDLNSSASLIGQPIPDLQLHILDEEMKAVPDGTQGEIYVGGPGVGRGYLNRPELTRDRFVPNPFSTRPGDRLYKSGDLAIRMPNGDIQYLGRADFQVKVRGFRIELGEIESALLRHERIKEAVALVQDHETDDPKIVAYLIPEEGELPRATEIRQFLRNLIPDYMIPNVIVPIQELPLTVNGKLERKALPWPPKVKSIQ